MSALPPSEARVVCALMRDALNAAGTAVWEWDVEGDRLRGMRFATALLGYAPGEIEASRAGWERLIHPADQPGRLAVLQRHQRGETLAYEHEHRVRAKSGEWRWMCERGRIAERLADGSARRMVGTLADGSERRRTQGAALKMAERLRRITQHVPGVVFQFKRTADGGRSFPYLSDRCEELFSIDRHTLMADAGALLRAIEPADREAVLASIDDSMRSRDPWHAEFRVHRPDGPVRWVTGDASPHPEPGGSFLWHGYFRDITALRELEQARAASFAAQAASQAKTEFLSRMSHELRTPLNAVLGFAQLMELDSAEPLGPEQRRRLALVRAAGAHLLQMIGDLLDLARVESGHLALQMETVPLALLLRESAELLRPQAHQAGITLHAEALDPALSVRADRMRLRQVMLNLLGNAIKYNRTGGSVSVRAGLRDGLVCIDVIDTGVGIAADDLGGLFEPFNRLGFRDSQVEGAGMGLPITRALVGLMRGRIEVQSVPSEGSTFSVLLPVAAADPEQEPH